MAILNDRTELTTPVDADYIHTVDASDTTDAASGTSKKLTWANIKATLKTYLDTLYAPVLGVDDNYVTDAEKTVIGNTSGTNTGDQVIPVTGVDFDPVGTDNSDDNAVNTLYASDYRAANFVSGTDYEPAKGVDDNFVTDAEKTVIGNTSGTNSGDNAANTTYASAKTKTDWITVTQAVDLDQMETDINALSDGMTYKGDWDASVGTFPGGGTAQTGAMYYVSVGGTVDSVVFAAGDNIVATTDNASTTTYAANWSKHDQTDAVASVNTQVGSVVLDADDIDDTSTTNKFVTAADITVLGNTSGTNTGDEVAADLTTAGVVELATGAETNTGTDATRAVTPDGLDDWTGSAQVVTVGTLSAGNADAAVSDASATAKGKVELATIAETDTGTDTTRALTSDGLQGSIRNLRFIDFVVVDPATDVATGTGLVTWSAPFAGTIVQDDSNKDYFAAYTTTAGTTGTMVVDIHKGGTTIMTTNKLDIETTELDTTLATTQPDLTTTTFSAGDVFTIDVDAVHTTAAKGLVVRMAVRPD